VENIIKINMKSVLIILLWLLSVLFVFTYAQYYVDSSVAVTGNGSKSQPFKTIQEGLNKLSSNTGTLNVASGTYSGPGNCNLTVSSTFSTITGNGSLNTIIDCANQGSGFDFFSGTFIVSGFTIQNCRRNIVNTSNNSDPFDGSGAAFRARSVSIKVTDLRLYNNFAERHGGGIFIESLYLNATSCFIENNHANGNGGGVYLGSASLELTADGAVESNSAANAGNDVYCVSAHIEIHSGITLADIPSVVCQGCSVSKDNVPITATCGAIGSLSTFTVLLLIALASILLLA